GEQAGEDPAQRALFVEKADAANAKCVIAPAREAGNDVGGVEDAGCFGDGFAAGEADGERPRVLARPDERGQEAGEEGLVSRVSEIAGGVAFLPGTARQHRGQVWGAAPLQAVAGHVVAQRVEG